MSIKRFFLLALVMCWSTTAQATGFDGIATTTEADQIVGIYDCETGVSLTERDHVPADMTEGEVLLAAAGNCVMRKDEFDALYCESGTCTGTCRLANFPLKCRCE
ncbi:MAG: hypothetical protein AAF678_11110 [Pseudomonadota bacterium]